MTLRIRGTYAGLLFVVREEFHCNCDTHHLSTTTTFLFSGMWMSSKYLFTRSPQQHIKVCRTSICTYLSFEVGKLNWRHEIRFIEFSCAKILTIMLQHGAKICWQWCWSNWVLQFFEWLTTLFSLSELIMKCAESKGLIWRKIFVNSLHVPGPWLEWRGGREESIWMDGSSSHPPRPRSPSESWALKNSWWVSHCWLWGAPWNILFYRDLLVLLQFAQPRYSLRTSTRTKQAAKSSLCRYPDIHVYVRVK